MRLDGPSAAVALGFALLALAGCSGDKGAPEIEVPTTGSIAGFVVTEAIAPIPGANITVSDNRTTTNATGGFVFEGLLPGLYVVEAEAATFLDRQTTVQVNAGNVTEVRLVLPVNASALAFHQTFTFKGFVDAHGGTNSPELGECRCDFNMPLDGSWLTIIVEAEWADPVSPPVGETEYAWSIASESGSVNGTGPSPLLGRVDAGGLPAGGSEADIRVEPFSDWVFASQSFDVLVTIWYGEAAPPGFQSFG
ncbi:MAG: carboxypeptidase-like regulatory domain-containing protein [Candidatus Thermoplasmatota archaeon]|jgi:hypothetical protein